MRLQRLTVAVTLAFIVTAGFTAGAGIAAADAKFVSPCLKTSAAQPLFCAFENCDCVVPGIACANNVVCETPFSQFGRCVCTILAAQTTYLCIDTDGDGVADECAQTAFITFRARCH